MDPQQVTKFVVEWKEKDGEKETDCSKSFYTLAAAKVFLSNHRKDPNWLSWQITEYEGIINKYKIFEPERSRVHAPMANGTYFVCDWVDC